MTTDIFDSTTDCEIVSSRIFKYARSLVFRAWSEPEHLRKWWGPHGFTNTFHEFDFREGGRWQFTMHGPEKGNYANECVFIRIEVPSLIAWERLSKPIFHVVATFEEMTAERTKLVFRMLFGTADECSKIKRFAVDKNEENFDRLEQVLAALGAPQP